VLKKIHLYCSLYTLIAITLCYTIYADDINHDKKINITDAILALQVSSGILNEIAIPNNLTWKGEWKEGIQYHIHEIVSIDGSSYICILDHISSFKTNPLNNPGIWEIFAKKGDSQIIQEIDPTVPENLKDGIQWNDIIYNRVGIGTYFPESKLHVVGDVNIDGKLIINGNLSIPYFALNGTRESESSYRKLNWTPVIIRGYYEIYRNNNLIETVNSDILSYTDKNLKLTGSIYYKIIGKFENENNIYSSFETNTLEFADTLQPDFGDGTDGNFRGGTIDRGRNYFFQNIHMEKGAVMDFTGKGNGFIKIKNDITIMNGSYINLRTVIDFNPGIISFNGISRNLNTASLNYGTPGFGGNGEAWGSHISGKGGTGGSSMDGTVGGYAYDNSKIYEDGSGEGGTYPGGSGGNGKRCSADSNFTGGGGGGAAGKHGESGENIAFIVGGNVLIEGTINGIGKNGGSGGSGGNGTDSYEPVKYGYSGGGGGGAGGAGGHGGNVYIFCKGSYNANNATLNLQGGNGGNGGKGGNGYSNGTDGSIGGKGNKGILEYINVQ